MIKETIKKLEEIIDKSNNRELKEDIEEVIYNLEQPITLVDFLGWAEDQEYEYNDNIFKIINNKLYSKIKNESKFYETLLLPLNYFESLRNASKFETKKYYLKLKEEHFIFLRYAFKKDSKYLNFNELNNEYYLETKEEIDEFKTKFTKEEIENIKLPDNITLDMFDMIEVDGI
ncbi:hypothetical protein B7939_00560 [Eggerthia catenaformis]|nr:hypothetical protein B7939_00560 [Eggerthia catenaformis]